MSLDLNLKATIRCPQHRREDGNGREITCPQCSHIREVRARWLDLIVAIREGIGARLIVEMPEGQRESLKT
jgi:DNA-directed RNA polymerase subunit RPC12/RpoP